jgi:NADH:ubiquinone oxidoreductase subunit 5 (subunit L)/multisubunit Na+/H+ antiporter MnhA subunit
MTLLRGRWAAIVEKDFKRIVAFSTLRQLGIILTRISLITPLISWFHLSSHALFKSALFVWVGVIIINSRRNQNNRIFGANSIERRSWSSWSIIILFNLTALPVRTGFLSKERFASHLTTLIFLLAIRMTLIYSWRMFKTANKTNNLKINQSTLPNIPLINTLPLLVFGIIWTINISVPTLPPTFWILALLTIRVWVWILKMNSIIFYKITNSVKLILRSHRFNEKWLYQWSWNSLATKQISIAAIAVLISII